MKVSVCTDVNGSGSGGRGHLDDRYEATHFLRGVFFPFFLGCFGFACFWDGGIFEQPDEEGMWNKRKGRKEKRYTRSLSLSLTLSSALVLFSLVSSSFSSYPREYPLPCPNY